MQSATRTVRTMRPSFFVRTFATSTPTKSRWSTGPAPPRLPKEEQEIFERLQQQSTGASTSASTSSEADKMLEQLRARAQVAAKGDGEELHPNIRRGAAPEFEGEVNPQTGEVGGPKNDPLRWKGDWSYNGRVTDF
ncbi:hypothetical protein BST61_g9324 [Cercospora zeina]